MPNKRFRFAFLFACIAACAADPVPPTATELQEQATECERDPQSCVSTFEDVVQETALMPWCLCDSAGNACVCCYGDMCCDSNGCAGSP